jgi:hypothetical protein
LDAGSSFGKRQAAPVSPASRAMIAVSTTSSTSASVGPLATLLHAPDSRPSSDALPSSAVSPQVSESGRETALSDAPCPTAHFYLAGERTFLLGFDICEAALHVKPRLTPSSFGLGTASLREVVHPSVRALGGEARSPAHGGVRWAGALSLARFSTEAKDFDSRSPAFRILQRFAALSPVAGDD